MKLTALKVQQVEHMPKVKEPGVLYVSKKFETCIHLCACGCGEETVTPQQPKTGWARFGTDKTVTLRPSISNPWCGSHYYVTDNKIDWL